jgi:hypothetical protein
MHLMGQLLGVFRKISRVISTKGKSKSSVLSPHQEVPQSRELEINDSTMEKKECQRTSTASFHVKKVETRRNQTETLEL